MMTVLKQMGKAAAPWIAMLIAGYCVAIFLGVADVQAIKAYIDAHWIELISAFCGVIGTTVLALNGPRAGWGFVWYIASNVGWIAFAAGTRQWPLLVQNVVFTASSLLGVWMWLIVKRRPHQVELDEMRARKDEAYEEASR